ncbi:MAG: Calvin cycle protein CP12 [Elainellaceae cyanobacterium]
MVYTATLTTPTSATHSTLARRLQAALEHARRLTDMYGSSHKDVAIAWETVEELTTAHYRQTDNRPTAFSLYCAANPHAPECRIYED